MKSSHPQARAPRVAIPNKEEAVLTIQNSRLRATLHRLSATGGLVQLPKPVPSGTLADIRLRTVAGDVVGAVELLPANGSAPAQGFRFLRLELDDRRRLETVLQQMRKHGLGERQPSVLDPLVAFAQRTITLAKKQMTRLVAN